VSGRLRRVGGRPWNVGSVPVRVLCGILGGIRLEPSAGGVHGSVQGLGGGLVLRPALTVWAGTVVLLYCTVVEVPVVGPGV
jgi:hypothetical protein